MRRGCVSLGNVQCDECRRMIPHAERYVAVEEDNGVEAETGKTALYCVACSLKKGYAYYREDRGEKKLTIFPKSNFQLAPPGADNVQESS